MGRLRRGGQAFVTVRKQKGANLLLLTCSSPLCVGVGAAQRGLGSSAGRDDSVVVVSLADYNQRQITMEQQITSNEEKTATSLKAMTWEQLRRYVAAERSKTAKEGEKE